MLSLKVLMNLIAIAVYSQVTKLWSKAIANMVIIYGLSNSVLISLLQHRHLQYPMFIS